MSRFRQWLRHRLGRNTGRVTGEWRDNRLYIGFACECGRVHDWRRVPLNRFTLS